MSLTKWDIESLITHYFTQAKSVPQPVAFPQPPADLNPIADAIREGFQSIANAIEYAAQIKEPPNPHAVAAELIKIATEMD